MRPVRGEFRSSVSAGLAALVLVASSCSDKPAGVPTTQPKQPVEKAAAAVVTDKDRADAKEIFVGRCTPCHGEKGAGDGPASATLTPRPRNFQDATWQKSVTDEHISKIIKYGGAAVGKAPMMPANPDLTEKEATVAALVAHVRSLSK